MTSKIDILVNAITGVASKNLGDVRDKIEGIGVEARQSAKDNKDFNDGLTHMVGQAGMVIGAVAAIGAAVKQGFEFAREGAELDFTREKFDRLSASVGTTGDALLNDLGDATRGLYSDAQLVGSALDFMGLGLAKSHDEAVRLASISSALNMNMNQLVLTLTNQTTMRFDALGVAVDGFDEKVEALEDTGMSANDAFNEAFLQQAEEQIEKVGHAADSSIGSFMRLESSWENITDTAKRRLTPALADLAEYLSDDLDRIGIYRKKLDEVSESMGWWEKQLEGTLVAQGYVQGMTRELTSDTDSATRSYIAWGESLQDGSEIVVSAAIPATEQLVSEFGGLLSITQDVGKEMERFNDKQDDLMAKSADLGVQIEEATLQYGAESEEVEKLNDKLAENQEKMSENADAYEESTNRRILKRTEEILAADGLTQAEEQALLRMGLAMGVYTQDYVTQAQTVIDRSQSIADSINAIPDHKRISIVADYSSIGDIEAWKGATPRESGGPVSAGMPYLVGEKRPEIFVPDRSGMIYPDAGTFSGGSSVQIVVNGSDNPERVADAVMRKLKRQGVRI